jgi:hypothetical protein
MVQTYRASAQGDVAVDGTYRTLPVMAGERVTLLASCQAGLVTWHIPGLAPQGGPSPSFVPWAVADYAGPGGPDGLPPLPLVNVEGGSITFYLTGANIKAGQSRRTMTITAVAPGGQKASVNLDVYTPSLTTHTASTCRLDVNNYYNYEGIVRHPAIGMGYNDACGEVPGLRWELKARVPGFTEPGFGRTVITGKLGMTQLIKTIVKRDDVTCPRYGTDGEWRADQRGLYGRTYNGINVDFEVPTVSVRTNGPYAPWVSVDLPNLNDLPRARWTLDDGFRDYVMYRPVNGIWVPVGGFTWQFGGTAEVYEDNGLYFARLVDTPDDRPIWPGNYDGDDKKVVHFELPYLSRAELAVDGLPANAPMPWPTWPGGPFTGPPRDTPCTAAHPE